MTINLDGLRQIAQAATQGPWTWTSRQTAEGVRWAVFDTSNPALASNNDGRAADAEYIATFDPPTVQDLIQRIEELEATLQRVRDARSNHPEIPECDRYTADDVIVCGWKSAVQSIDQALEGDPK